MFGHALGDMELAKKSLRTNATGLLVALLVSLLAGTLLPLDPSSESVLSRTNVNMGDVVLALASGSAGVLAFTTGAPASLIGVMVAVALLPPFAVFGLMLATGEFDLARGALMLVATNVICVNLAGVLTFVRRVFGPAHGGKPNARPRRLGFPWRFGSYCCWRWCCSLYRVAAGRYNWSRIVLAPSLRIEHSQVVL
ncbi:MAG: DUF389 domain-containing protein [Pirellulaceae bacterium]